MSNKEENTRPESLTLRLKKAEAAVEAATESLKSLRAVVESEGRGIANQAEQKHGDNLSKDLKKLNKQQAVVRKVLDKP
jgi:division protein CdvB (Snf7/Vps24/ESCRT-III family)